MAVTVTVVAVMSVTDPETVRMDLPVKFQLNPAATGDNFNWNGVSLAQFTGAVVYRVPEVLYFNWAA